MNRKELIGCWYPVVNNEHKVIGFRTIKAAFDLRDTAGFAISLESTEPESVFIISYYDASQLTKRSPILD